jgi:type I restriction enzyme S subunit
MSWKEVLLGDILSYEQPTRYIVESEDYNDSYQTPVLTAGKSFILGYTNESDNIYENLPAIIFDDFTADSKFVDFPFKVKSSAMKILKCDPEKVDIRFAFYLMQTLKVDTEQHKRYWISKFANISVPLPPLPIQKRIADILDAADALRKKDQELLKKYDELAQAIFIDMFGNPVKNEKGWDVKKLGDVFNVASGGTPATTNPDYWTDGYIPWIGSNMCKDSIIRETDGKYITEDGLNNSSARIFAKGTVIVALVGATIGKVGLIELDCSTNQNVAGLQILPKSEVNSIFSFYMMKNLYYKFDELGGDKFKMANLSFVRGLPFWLPPLKLQEKFKAKISLLTNQRDFLLGYQNLKLFESLLQKAFSGDLVS